MKNSIAFNLKSNEHDIDVLEKKSSAYLKALGFSDDRVHDQTMILRELIECGLQYGRIAPSEIEINVCIQVTENTITVEVKNPIEETCYNRLKELDKTIQFIRGYQDPFEAYAAVQKKELNYIGSSETNRSTLARIVYEGKIILDFFVSEDHMLNLTSVSSLVKN